MPDVQVTVLVDPSNPDAETITLLTDSLTDQTYIETLQLQTENLEGDGFNIREDIKIEIPPGETHLLKMKIVDSS